jgi:hypothetical protein
MPNHRGRGKQPNGSRRGQAPSNRGRGQGQTSRFADYSQPEIMGYTDTDDCELWAGLSGSYFVLTDEHSPRFKLQ